MMVLAEKVFFPQNLSTNCFNSNQIQSPLNSQTSSSLMCSPWQAVTTVLGATGSKDAPNSSRKLSKSKASTTSLVQFTKGNPVSQVHLNSSPFTESELCFHSTLVLFFLTVPPTICRAELLRRRPVPGLCRRLCPLQHLWRVPHLLQGDRRLQLVLLWEVAASLPRLPQLHHAGHRCLRWRGWLRLWNGEVRFRVQRNPLNGSVLGPVKYWTNKWIEPLTTTFQWVSTKMGPAKLYYKIEPLSDDPLSGFNCTFQHILSLNEAKSIAKRLAKEARHA